LGNFGLICCPCRYFPYIPAPEVAEDGKQDMGKVCKTTAEVAKEGAEVGKKGAEKLE
jgi:hypothetical protein